MQLTGFLQAIVGSLNAVLGGTSSGAASVLYAGGDRVDAVAKTPIGWGTRWDTWDGFPAVDPPYGSGLINSDGQVL